MDYKHFGQTVQLGKDSFDSPITYYPLTASYGGTWQQEKALTQFNLGLTFNLRGPGSGFEEFDAKRGYANSSFIHLNADIAQTRELKHGFELFGSAKAQIADGPLVSSEQFSLGGLDTVRGYYESEAIGDNGLVGTLELRSPNIGDWLQTKINAAHKGTPPASDGKHYLATGWRIRRPMPGIGRACVEDFARNGAAIVVADINETAAAEAAELARSHGATAHSIGCDVRDEDSVRNAVDYAERELGGIDTLVFLAGLMRTGIGSDAPLHRQRRGRVELAVHQGMNHHRHFRLVLRQSIFVRRHRALPRSDISWPRARASRDITVPIGTSSITAMSR